MEQPLNRKARRTRAAFERTKGYRDEVARRNRKAETQERSVLRIAREKLSGKKEEKL